MSAPDTFQGQAIISVMEKMKWKAMSILAASDDYGMFNKPSQTQGLDYNAGEQNYLVKFRFLVNGFIKFIRVIMIPFFWWFIIIWLQAPVVISWQ